MIVNLNIQVFVWGNTNIFNSWNVSLYEIPIIGFTIFNFCKLMPSWDFQVAQPKIPSHQTISTPTHDIPITWQAVPPTPDPHHLTSSTLHYRSPSPDKQHPHPITWQAVPPPQISITWQAVPPTQDLHHLTSSNQWGTQATTLSFLHVMCQLSSSVSCSHALIMAGKWKQELATRDPMD